MSCVSGRISVELLAYGSSMPKYTLHGPLTASKAFKAELVAAFAGVELHRPPFTWGLSSRTPRFLAMSPSGKVQIAQCTVSACTAWLRRYIVCPTLQQSCCPKRLHAFVKQAVADTSQLMVCARALHNLRISTFAAGTIRAHQQPMRGSAPCSA